MDVVGMELARESNYQPSPERAWAGANQQRNWSQLMVGQLDRTRQIDRVGR